VADSLLSRPTCLRELTLPDEGTVICRGQGRSYGDAAISSDGLVVITSGAHEISRFDADSGVLVAEAGLTFDDMLRTVVPLGWFPPVTPGTKHVSLGGAVAADIHGKNHHHDGSIGSHIIELELVLADGRHVTCSQLTNAELFWATVGGMGLTGMIVNVTLQLIPIETSSIATQHVKAPNLEAAFRCFEDGEYDDQYTVAWIDCLSRGRSLGRSVVIRGHHARRGELKAQGLSVNGDARFSIPIDCPSFVVNPLGVAIFNQLYYSIQGRKTRQFAADFDQFFYPLDVVSNWNRLYGKRGFLQYQFVVPEAGAFAGTCRVLERVVSRRRAIFLAILKRFGPGNPAPLSFPTSGYTLALDLPMTGPDTLRLLDELDEIVLEYGGRVYLAKDARLSPDRFRRMYPRLGEWRRVKQVVDPHERFTSDLSRRLGLSGGTIGRPRVEEAEQIEHA
jgi:FAD/FMN-containing dehydrogenase